MRVEIKEMALKLYNFKLFMFLFVAGTSAFFELGLYTILFELVLINPIVASPISQILGMLFNFTLNKVFTFKTGRAFNAREFIGFLLVWSINLVVTTIFMTVTLTYTSIYPTVLRFFIMVVMFMFNFVILKKLVFKTKPQAN